MIRHILLLLLLPAVCLAARKTKVISSAVAGTGRTADNVTVNSTSWSVNNGTITLSATVPNTVHVGDVITDSATNGYVITSISGSVLTCQDWTSTIDPATGSATIDEAYNTIAAGWEADLDDTIKYAAGDTAELQLYDDGGAFDEEIIIDGGGTVGLGLRILTAPVAERHNGTAGTGARIVLSGSLISNHIIQVSAKTIVEWLEIDANGQSGSSSQVGLVRIVSGGANSTIRQMIVHDYIHNLNNDAVGILNMDQDGVVVENNVVYNISNIASGGNAAVGIDQFSTMSSIVNNKFLNNTVFNITNSGGFGTRQAYGIRINSSGTGHECRNNISMDAASGAANDEDFNLHVNVTESNNMSSDTTGTGTLINKVASNQFVSTTSGSEDLHLKTGADAIDAGTDLGTTPNGVEIDIDGRDRDANGDIWDVGADEFVAAAPARRIFIVD